MKLKWFVHKTPQGWMASIPGSKRCYSNILCGSWERAVAWAIYGDADHSLEDLGLPLVEEGAEIPFLTEVPHG